MECFRQVFRLVKSPFRRSSDRILEIGAPTHVKNDLLPTCSQNEDRSMPHNPDTSRCKDEKDTVVEVIQLRPFAREKFKNRVRRLSIRIACPILGFE
ncbi:hypothetical protein BDV32DRAFT_155169 [Aspergillus pseudonomiae]|nr:hypothetical protein BDV32DRAFT_155169 [Aspergillus pseudonomiae]